MVAVWLVVGHHGLIANKPHGVNIFVLGRHFCIDDDLVAIKDLAVLFCHQ